MVGRLVFIGNCQMVFLQKKYRAELTIFHLHLMNQLERNYLLKNAYRETVGHSAEDFSNPRGVPLQFFHQRRLDTKQVYEFSRGGGWGAFSTFPGFYGTL